MDIDGFSLITHSALLCRNVKMTRLQSCRRQVIVMREHHVRAFALGHDPEVPFYAVIA